MNNDQQTNAELLPCPFCGKQPTYRRELLLTEREPEMIAYCETKGCPAYRTGVPLETWNTRTAHREETAEWCGEIDSAYSEWRRGAINPNLANVDTKHGFTQGYAVAKVKYTTLQERIEQLEKQLPTGMEHCTIQFKECELGHGWLTATNWMQHGCKKCEMDKLQAKVAKYEHRERENGDAMKLIRETAEMLRQEKS